ncbi:MAG: hypothetical protein ACE5J3_09075 [Methanosarcinales archaeon]
MLHKLKYNQIQVFIFILILSVLFTSVVQANNKKVLKDNINLNTDYVFFYEDFEGKESKYVDLNPLGLGGYSREGITYEVVNSSLHVNLTSGKAKRPIGIKNLVPLPESIIEFGVRNSPHSWIHARLYYGGYANTAKYIDVYYYYSATKSQFRVYNGKETIGTFYPSINHRYKKHGVTWDKYKIVIHKNHTISAPIT